MIDCSQQNVYDLTPVNYCRKIKYKGTLLVLQHNEQLLNSFVCHFFHSIHFIEKNDWVYLRDCNVKDNKKLDDAQVYLCDTDACNAVALHHPTILFTLSSTVFVFLRLLRI